MKPASAALTSIACLVLSACAKPAPVPGEPFPARSLVEAPVWKPEAFLPPSRLCGANEACLASPLIASSPQELQWLRRNGYPSFLELRNAKRTDDTGLRKEIADGSNTARIVLAQRLANRGDLESVVLLRGAAMQGSLYAFHVLAEVHARQGDQVNRWEAAAYLLAASRLGDYKAERRYRRDFGSFSPGESRLARLRADDLLLTLAPHHAVDPRPSDVCESCTDAPP